MARPLRIDIPNGLYHVTSRGWERRVIMRDDEDRERWRRLLERVAVRCGWRVFAWALMNNHFHLYLRTPEANLSAGMHDLNSGYASVFNRRHRRSGSLFQGRFKAILVEDESHSLELSRYVHLNPVRAKLVARPKQFAWSSYREYLGARKPPAWLDCQAVLSEFGRDRRRCRLAYRRFVETGISRKVKSPLAEVVGGMFLGTSGWVERWRRRLAGQASVPAIPTQRQLAWRPTLEDVVQAVSQAFGVAPGQLLLSRRRGNDGRLVAIYLSRELTDERVGTIGRYFGGVSWAAISKAVRRAEARREEDRRWDRQLARLTAQLSNPPAPAPK
jgi:putative transposase